MLIVIRFLVQLDGRELGRPCSLLDRRFYSKRRQLRELRVDHALDLRLLFEDERCLAQICGQLQLARNLDRLVVPGVIRCYLVVIFLVVVQEQPVQHQIWVWFVPLEQEAAHDEAPAIERLAIVSATEAEFSVEELVLGLEDRY